MAEQKLKDIILDTIDQLRKRKARPDIDRICSMVLRKHNVPYEETGSALSTLIDAGIVIKVDYKGSTSYRNAAKWRKSHLGLNVKEIHAALDRAIRALKAAAAKKWESASVEGTGLDLTDVSQVVNDVNQNDEEFNEPRPKGVTIGQIETWLIDNDPETKLQKNILQIALTREVEFGRLLHYEDGSYGVGEHTKRVPGKNAKPSCVTFVQKISPPKSEKREQKPEKEKRKRIKKTHGPDFESYDHIQGDDKCDYCLLTAQCNRNGEPERLLICKDCNAKAHPSCMNYSESLARRARDSPWQCIDCKTCYMCNDSGDAVSDEMLFCDACDKGYHMSCHDPAITEKPTGKWMCSSCVLEDGDDSSMDQSNSPTSEMNDSCNTDGGPSYLPTPVHSPVLHPVMNGHASPSEMLRPIALPAVNMVKKETIPDASTWIIDDVVDYFKTKGFEEQAEVFREQEIDGKSLLLLKRNDVLTGLSLKLGPALKMYKHVEKLQSRDTIV